MSNDARMGLVYVLVVVVLLANVTMAADKVALDADHTIERLGEKNVYGEVRTVVQSDTVERVNQTIEERKEQYREEELGDRDRSERKRELLDRRIDTRLPDRQQRREFVTSAITGSFVRSELTRNVRTI